MKDGNRVLNHRSGRLPAGATIVVAACMCTTAQAQSNPWDAVNLWGVKWPGYPSVPSPVDDPHLNGHWAPLGAVSTGPPDYLYGVHAALLYGGGSAKLVLFRNMALVYDLDPDADPKIIHMNTAGTQNDPSFPPTWDEDGHQLFCAGYVPLSDGRLLIVGGPLDETWFSEPNDIPIDTGWATIFDPSDPASLQSSWIDTDDLPAESGGEGCTPVEESAARYYPTLTRLEDGRILLTSGDFWLDCDHDGVRDNDSQSGEFNRQELWAIYDPAASLGNRWTIEGQGFTNPWATLNPGDAEMFSYPHVKMLPYGLFYAGNDYLGDSSTSPSYLWTPLSDWGLPTVDYLADEKLQNRVTSSCIVLTMDATRDSMSVLLIGGGADGDQPFGSEAAEIITYERDGTTGAIETVGSGWIYTPMNSEIGRGDGNAVLLPDGKVLEIGGEQAEDNQNHSCELFTPKPTENPPGTWETVAPLNRDRGHHSVALLLPDGRVFSSGHENCIGAPPCEPVYGKNYQIYYPPYLFADANTWAVRETIETWPDFEDPEAPGFVPYGLPFEITLADGDATDIDEVVIMAPGAVTHAASFSQSRVLLSHSVDPEDASRLIVTGPKDETYAPEGHYMLFVLDDNDVPSEARWVNVQRSDGDYVVEDGETERWAGHVWLDRDFVVEPGGTLNILPGTVVHVESDVDKGNHPTLGVDPTRVEIIVQGQLLASSTPSPPIEFTSTTDGSANDLDNWYGIRFDVGGCCEGYGFGVGFQPLSKLENVNIENAKYGVRIEDFQAPTLKSVTFADIGLGQGSSPLPRHIYIYQTDIFIPYGYLSEGLCDGPVVQGAGEWNLTPGTCVLFTSPTASHQDLGCLGEVDMVDILVDGLLITGATAGDSVYFRPEDFTSPSSSTAGRDWGGLFFSAYSSGSAINMASIGYALNPVYMYYPPQQFSITNSNIHHFAGTGLWVYRNYASGTDGPVFDNIRVDRDSDLHPTLTDTGIFFDASDGLDLTDSEVNLAGRNHPGNVVGLAVYLSTSTCTTGSARTFLINKNIIRGPAPFDQLGDNLKGMSITGACSSSVRTFEINENTVVGWKQYGMELFNPNNIQIRCNQIIDSRSGIDVSRSDSLQGTANFRFNHIEVKSSDPALFAFRTNEALRTKLGPYAANGVRGRNELGVHLQDTKFIYENDVAPSGPGDQLNAENNYWSLWDGAWSQLAEDVDGIIAVSDRIKPDGANVDFQPMQTGTPASGCQWPMPGTLAPLVQAVPPEDPLAANAYAPILPAELSLGPMRPNPARNGGDMSLAVPQDHVGEFLLEVFDVRGRNVFSSPTRIDQPGRYVLKWQGWDRSGKALSAGIYFLRVQGPGSFHQTQKVTLLR